jgi:16S rRNA (guanine527-N7)-methyltransferase
VASFNPTREHESIVETSRIAELLQPFVAGAELTPNILDQLQRYLDLLLRWNARMNLTAVRDPEQIVTRHFGESLFAARMLLADSPPPKPATQDGGRDSATEAVPIPIETLADVGSGAGFPGIPIKLFAPHIGLTLIESKVKKATFLREIVRSLQLNGVDVYCGRAEDWGRTADAVTLRAVENFQQVLPVATNLVATGGKLCLLIGSAQTIAARELAGNTWTWSDPVPIPLSDKRVVLIARPQPRMPL